MQKRTVNLVLALVTGRVGHGKPDIWDCDYWMQIIADVFVPCLGVSESIHTDRSHQYFKPMFLKRYAPVFMSTGAKKRAGMDHTSCAHTISE